MLKLDTEDDGLIYLLMISEEGQCYLNSYINKHRPNGRKFNMTTYRSVRVPEACINNKSSTICTWSCNDGTLGFKEIFSHNRVRSNCLLLVTEILTTNLQFENYNNCF
jgi:hypothetical protein